MKYNTSWLPSEVTRCTSNLAIDQRTRILFLNNLNIKYQKNQKGANHCCQNYKIQIINQKIKFKSRMIRIILVNQNI